MAIAIVEWHQLNGTQLLSKENTRSKGMVPTPLLTMPLLTMPLLSVGTTLLQGLLVAEPLPQIALDL